MQGDPKVIDYLNKGLRSELTAINQYWLHYRLLNNWGLLEMAKVWRKESIEEMEHADKFTDRILFLDGFPNMQVLDPLRIGQNVKEIIECDLASEIAARTPLSGSRNSLPQRQGLRVARPVRTADEGRGASYRLPRNPTRPDQAYRARALHPEACRRVGERGLSERSIYRGNSIQFVMAGHKREARLRVGCPGHPRLDSTSASKVVDARERRQVYVVCARQTTMRRA